MCFPCALPCLGCAWFSWKVNKKVSKVFSSSKPEPQEPTESVLATEAKLKWAVSGPGGRPAPRAPRRVPLGLCRLAAAPPRRNRPSLQLDSQLQLQVFITHHPRCRADRPAPAPPRRS